MVAANQIRVFFAIVQGRANIPTGSSGEFRTFLLIERQNHFRGQNRSGRRSGRRTRRAMPDGYGISPLTASACVFLVIQRLYAGVDVNNRQTFVSQNRFITGVKRLTSPDRDGASGQDSSVPFTPSSPASVLISSTPKIEHATFSVNLFAL